MIYISSCFEFPQNPEVFTFPLEVRHTHNETTGLLSLLYWAPAEWKPRSYVGFWVACVYFRRIVEQLWNRGRCINLISWQCQKKKKAILHTLSRVFKPTLTSPAGVFLFNTNVNLCLGGTYLWAQVNTVWRIQSVLALICQQCNYLLLPWSYPKSFSLHFFPFHRCKEGLVRPCFMVGEKEDMAAENPLDFGQVRHPSWCQAAFHTAAQAAASPAAQHEAHEGQGQLLGPRLQGCVWHLQNV